MRSVLRSKAWQADTHKPLTERQSMGRRMREQSKQTNSNKSTQIMDVNRATIRQTAQTHGADLLIHGHTHRPGDYPRRGQDAYRRIVLGDWHDCGWLCRQENDAFALECFSLIATRLAHRCENEIGRRLGSRDPRLPQSSPIRTPNSLSTSLPLILRAQILLKVARLRVQQGSVKTRHFLW